MIKRAGPLDLIAENLWVCEFPLDFLGISLGHRMTVIRLPAGGLLLHSPVPADPELRAQLALLGEVTDVVAPSRFHDSWMKEIVPAFPDARFHAPPAFDENVKGDRPWQSLAGPVPDEWREVIDLQLIAGMPRVNEVAVLHRPSRSLIVADLVFNIGPEANFTTRTFFKIYGGYGRPAPSRLYRAMIKDKPAMRSSLARVLEWDFDRLIPGHGEIIETGAREALRRGLDG